MAAKSTSQPFAKTFRQACLEEAIGKDRGLELCRSGEWQSFMDGAIRKVTVASVEARRARLLAQPFKSSPLRGHGQAGDGEEAA